jgi:hypothetical protein
VGRGAGPRRACARGAPRDAPPALRPALTRTVCDPSPAIRGTLATHQAEAEAAFEGLHASQKRLSAGLRRLLSALDGVLALSAPRPDAAALDQLRAAAGKARAMQAQLRGVAARLDKVETVLADLRARQPAPGAAGPAGAVAAAAAAEAAAAPGDAAAGGGSGAGA